MVTWTIFRTGEEMLNGRSVLHTIIQSPDKKNSAIPGDMVYFSFLYGVVTKMSCVIKLYRAEDAFKLIKMAGSQVVLRSFLNTDGDYNICQYSVGCLSDLVIKRGGIVHVTLNCFE